MLIKVKGYASLRKYTVDLPTEGEMDVPEGSTVDSVLRHLKIPSESEKIILVNGRHRSQDYVLQPGDILLFFPPLAGG